ncbi:MAG: RDD family protein [Betaproteobacteria bacterium]
METDGQPIIYVGFWARLLAQIVDSILISLIMIPLIRSLYSQGLLDFGRMLKSPIDFLMTASLQAPSGPLDFLVSYVLPAVVVVAFWMTKQATPGKMLVSARVVDATTLGKISAGQAIGRYFGYIVCMISLGLGFLWVGIDARKQGWHDKLASTLVIRNPRA